MPYFSVGFAVAQNPLIDLGDFLGESVELLKSCLGLLGRVDSPVAVGKKVAQKRKRLAAPGFFNKALELGATGPVADPFVAVLAVFVLAAVPRPCVEFVLQLSVTRVESSIIKRVACSVELS